MALLGLLNRLIDLHHNYGEAVNFFHRRLKTCFQNLRGKIQTPIPELINSRLKFGKRPVDENNQSESNVSKRTKLRILILTNIKTFQNQSKIVNVN